MNGDQGGLIVPAFAALAAACAFGAAAALQHQQAGQAPRARTPSLRLLADVARRPLWLAGVALATAAYGLQALALAYGPLTLVAPIVAADLLFALPLAARWARRPLRARDWAGCLLVAAGVAIFLSTAPPATERRDVPVADWIVVFGAVIVIALIAVTVSRVTRGSVRAGMLAAAAGVIFGLTAAVTASFTRSLRQDGLVSVLSHWQPWVLISLGITGILLSTAAFQAGSLSASLPIIDTVEPVSAVIIGAVLFDERLSSSPGGLMVQLGAAAVAVTGIAMLGPSLAAVQSPAALSPADESPDARQRRAVPQARAECDLLKTGPEPGPRRTVLTISDADWCADIDSRRGARP
jgi:drug/metabolite transporter (DMT)-like permease